MKLHLPLFLRKSVLSCLALVAGYTLSSGTLAFADDLVLGAEDTLSIDYAAADSIPDLENGTLQLDGDTLLQLLNCGSGDGKTYTLATGVSGLVDAEGNPISLDSTNNAISNYFDADRPGTGFWADATLQLSADGILRLVRHSEAVKPAVTISTRQTGSAVDYQYHEGVHFADIEYTSNSSAAYGGAIYGYGNSTITLSDNGSVTFSGNTASSSSDYSACGGAIYGREDITLSHNGSVVFEGNTASSRYSCGGAIYGDSDSTITLSDNGSVTFSGNTASSSDARGGAIYTDGDLSIRNNDSVEFYQNAEVNGNTYRLRSIYAYGGNGAEISLSAAAGKSITFRDSIYIGEGSSFKLNEAYEGKAQLGDIIFTGATTVDDLYTVKGNVAGTTEEIRLSRTTEVNTLTNLYGGRLRVEDGAIYLGQGITVHEGSEATVRVKDAELSHAGYNLTFNDGTALEVAGESTIRGLVNLQEGSVFKLEQGATLNLYETNGVALSVGGLAWLEGASTLNADLTLAESSTLDIVSLDAGAVALNGVLTFGGHVTLGENLLALLDEKLGHESSITLFTGLENVDWATVTGNAVSDCVWAGAVFSNMAGNHSYYLNYASDTGSLVMQIVPEPATATLSLLALAALAARRRIK